MQTDISQEFHDFILDIEDLLNASGSMNSDDLSRAKEKLNARIESAKKTFSDASGSLAHSAKETAATTNKYVHENPWQAIGVGATVGLLLGLLFTRRKSNNE
jgi:ElaB/YqjD/DUF883 family membrane-anchored ribosome-binding protein